MSDLSRRSAVGTFLTAIFGGPTAAKEIAESASKLNLGLGGLMAGMNTPGYPIAQGVDPVEHDYVSERVKDLQDVIAGKFDDYGPDIYTGQRMDNIKENLKALKSPSKVWKSLTYYQKRDDLNTKQRKFNAKQELMRFLGLQKAGIKDADSHQAYMWDKENKNKNKRKRGYDTPSEKAGTNLSGSDF